MYAWITCHSQNVQSPISNDYLRVMFDDQKEPQLVPKVILKLSVIELHNSLVSDNNYGSLKEDRDEYDNIIISDSTLRLLFSPQLKQKAAQYKVMCSCEYYISSKSVHSSLISWGDQYLKKLKDQSLKYQSRRSGEKSHHIYETYKNTVMPHERHIYSKACDMEKAIMCKNSQSDYALPNWKCVLWYCSKFPCINLPDKETDKRHEKTTSSNGFTFITSLDFVLIMVEFH